MENKSPQLEQTGLLEADFVARNRTQFPNGKIRSCAATLHAIPKKGAAASQRRRPSERRVSSENVSGSVAERLYIAFSISIL